MKKLSVLLMMSMLSCGLLFTGCGDKEPEETTTTVEADADEDEDDAEEETEEASGAEEVIDDVATALQADGRDYGQTFELTTDDVMQSAFFDMNINSIRLTKELEDYAIYCVATDFFGMWQQLKELQIENENFEIKVAIASIRKYCKFTNRINTAFIFFIPFL